MIKNKSEIKLIALDMDGTLLNDEHEVSAYTQTVIEKAVDQHIEVVLSTGRWFDVCAPYADLLKLNSHLITVNGGEIWTPTKELLKRHVFETTVIKDMWNIGKKLGMKMWLVSTTDVYYDGRPDSFDTHEWLKFSCDSDDTKKLAEMRKYLATHDVEITNSLPTNLEVNPSGVNKAHALQEVCQKLGITMDHVMAVGDSLNDIKMIEESGLGVAMGNAQTAVKQIADVETDTNNKDGVAKAILKYAL